MRTIAATRSSSVESDIASTPARLNASPTAASRARAASSKRLAEGAVARVHVELLARLGVLHDDWADVGQLDLARVDRRTASTSCRRLRQCERPLPARGR